MKGGKRLCGRREGKGNKAANGKIRYYFSLGYFRILIGIVRLLEILRLWGAGPSGPGFFVSPGGKSGQHPSKGGTPLLGGGGPGTQIKKI